MRLRGPNPVPPAFPCRSAPLTGCPAGARQRPEGGPYNPVGGKGWRRPAPRFGPGSPFARRYSGSLVVDFLSSGYLDVSVPPVAPLPAMSSPAGCADFSARVRPFGDPGIEGRVRLPRDYRGLPRPSSAPCAKASAVRPGYLPAPIRGRGAYPSHLQHLNVWVSHTARGELVPLRRSSCNLLSFVYADWLSHISHKKNRSDQSQEFDPSVAMRLSRYAGWTPGDRTRGLAGRRDDSAHLRRNLCEIESLDCFQKALHAP